ncbi:2,4-dienoyl-CoA reductase [Seinonella peptonophila]|uniref:2,4-dienoyl-CoA reductase n=1 Tax=Seinonella peptonophila TaxID=112248 RepID=A0A1M4TYI1_9BACL|nr:NADH:flavin oxidoreductase [Seinonella peptonophila]SHE49416.1 2,4-dienoyl-CoA reductase [Seinonella peptonophila]
MNRSVEALFKPFHTNKLTLPNRIVMAPMTRAFSPNGIPTEEVVDYYKRRAENEVGLIITEGTAINHPAASSDPNVPFFYGEAALKGWENVVTAVHQVGGKMIPQLWHVGIQRPVGSLPFPDVKPISPSGITSSGEKVTEAMTEKEIQAVIKAYADAATNAKRIGFDGIELHGAHGYLIDQFFWKATNKRTDKYGGNIVDRTRFAVEVIKACREAVGEDFPIVFRFSQWKTGAYTEKLAKSPQELEQFLLALSDAGVDIFHASTRRFWEPEFKDSTLNLAGWTKKLTGKPTITVGSVGLDDIFAPGVKAKNAPIDELINRLEQQEFDLVAVGRALLVDPTWAHKLHTGNTKDMIPYSPEALKTLS